jgi:DNA polymerase-3 subunit beta
MASQDIRFYLNGLLIKVEQKNIFFVSTDGHRLSYYNVVVEENIQAFSVIIPRKAILEIYKNLDISETKFIEIKNSKKFVSFTNANIEIKSKIIEGNFPDFTKVIPQENPIKIEIEREKLLKTLQRVSVLSNDKIRGIRLTFNDNKLMVLCSNQDRESAEETIDINYVFDPLEIGFNVNYLLDALSNINDDKITLGLRDQNSSMLIQKKGNEHFKYVVMPMRI